MNIHIHNHSYHEVVSGGDAIAAEFGKAWLGTQQIVTIFTNFSAKSFFVKRGISPVHIETSTNSVDTKNVLMASVVHTITGMILSIKTLFRPVNIIFSSSCMAEDLFPALIHKLFHPNARLVVSIYLIPQHPKQKTYGSNTINRYIFWLMFHIGMSSSRLFATHIWTASIEDERVLTECWHKNVTAIRGGVDVKMALKTKRGKPVYDGLYLGRFHPQKNILELLFIWKHVVKKVPNATLAIAGEGFLRSAIEKEIRRLRLTKNIVMLPPIDDKEKFNLYASAKIFLSASHYDTGNLALDEALATGTPAICYDISHLSYPDGVVLSPCYDVDQFIRNTIRLLTDDRKRETLGNKAQLFAQTLSWDMQAQKALASVTESK